MKYLRQLSLAALWMLLAMPLAAQVGGFNGPDDDRDGLPDDFEQAILEKFRPTWKISPTDCDGSPAEYLPGVPNPTVKARNGTIYGQVFVRASSALGFFVEAHFYDLWAEDCGYINSHPLDAEHVSVLIRATDARAPIAEWHASQWYAAAHEDTLCDSSQFASAAIIDSEDKGATFWIARGKHGAFFSPHACSIGGCGFDRCEASTTVIASSPVNIGESNAPLNGAVWTSSDRWPLLAKMLTDFPTFSTLSSLSYSFPDRGGATFSTRGSPVDTVIGYASVQPTTGDTSPAGVSIFSSRRNNVLVTEAAVPNSVPMYSGRIYAEVNGQVDTGVGIVNANTEAAHLSFFFTDSNGRSFGYNAIDVPARGLTGRFLDESPFNSGSFGTGTFTFTSSLPVSVVPLRSFTNERGEFLITTLPVTPLSPTVGQRVVFPQVVAGGDWTTKVALVNPTDDAISGTIEFFGQGTANTAADPLELTLNGQTGTTFTYTIAPRSSWVAVTAGTSADTLVGSGRITPSPSDSAPSGIAIVSLKHAGVVVTESGVPGMSSGSAFRLFVESSGSLDNAETGSLQTGIAIANLDDSAAAVSLELTTLTGMAAGEPGEVIIPARGQLALFLSQLPGFSMLPSPFQGVLRISSKSSNAISVIGLRVRYNERHDVLLATTAAVNESVASPAGETVFPYLAEGGGFTTQFILFSPTGHSSSGWLRFYTPSGTPLNLSMK